MTQEPKNILGHPLKPCCKFPMTGFFRDGYCRTCPEDMGKHIICIEATDEFLKFSKSVGNDLSTPCPEFEFPGLIAGDRWCLCALRWVEAYEAGAAPKVVLSAIEQSALEIVPIEILKQFAVNEEQDAWLA